MSWKPYDIKQCCPDLTNDCLGVAPLLNFKTYNPTTNANNDGRVSIQFIGLNKTYYTVFKGVGVNESGTTIGNRDYINLKPGQYSLSVKPDSKSVCRYDYIFTIKSFNSLSVKLKYSNGDDVPLHPDSGNLSIPANTQIYWNADNIIDRQEEGATQCFLLEITGGEPPYDIIYQDYLDYITPDVYLLNGNPIDLPQTTNNTLLERPPLILNKIVSNDEDILSFCVTLAYNFGNGWVKIIVKDSAVNPQQEVIWLYLKQTIF